MSIGGNACEGSCVRRLRECQLGEMLVKEAAHLSHTCGSVLQW